MNKILRLVSLLFFVSISQFTVAQVNVRVSVKSIAVSSALDCDAGGTDNSDFVFEYKIQDNSPFAFTNNTPVLGSIGMCNYVVVNEQNGPYVLTPFAPGAAVFSPTTGLFFDRSYNCKNEVPTMLTITWSAYENDDASAPSVAPIANGTVATQVNSYTVPTSNGTYTTQYVHTSIDGTCPQTYTIEFYVQKTIDVFSPLTLGVPEANVICTGASTGHLDCSVTGGSGTVLYDWSVDGLGDYDDNAIQNGVIAGTYTLVVKDALNCADTINVTIFETDAPAIISAFSTSTASVCTGATGVAYAVASQTNAVFYWSFSGPGAVMNGSGNAITLDFLNFSDDGILSIYAQNSCSVTPTFTMSIDVYQSPNLVIAGNNNICANTQEVLTASGATTYTWSTGVTSASVSVSPSSITIYTVSGTGPGGCLSTKEFTMNVMPTPTLQVNVSAVAVCPNQTVAATASGNGSVFFWSDGFIGTNHNVSAASTTIFTVTNTFTNSCYAQATFTLNVNLGPALSITGNTIVCPGGTVSLTASGANTYAWSNGVTTNTNVFVPASSSSLTVVGTASNGCVDSLTQAVKVVSTPTVSISGNDTICEGQVATLVASANGNVTYGWNSGANTQTITVSPLGTFTYVVIVNNGGCTASTSHEVFVKLVPTIDFTIATPLLCSNDAMITFTSNPSGGVYSGTGVTMGDMFDPGIGVGTYPITYQVSMSNGCVATASQTVDVMTCTGINNTRLKNGLNLFPNPTADDVTVISDRQIASVLVYDFSGKLIRIIEANTFETMIDMSSLAIGFYTFTITMSDKTQSSMKVLKE